MRDLIKLAFPVVMGYLGMMTMGLVDLIAVGRVSPAAIGAVGVGNSIFSWGMIFGIGLLTGLDYLVSHAFGAGKKEDCHRAWVQGLHVALVLGAVSTVVFLALSTQLGSFGINPEVLGDAVRYLQILSLSLIPVFVFSSCRQYLQGMGIAKPVTIIMIVANLINALANYVLVFGNWGFPRWEAAGSACATLISRVWMMFALLGYVYLWDRRNHGFIRSLGLKWDAEPFRKLVRLGFPSALQMTFEVGVFALSTTLAAKLSAAELAAHQIVLNTASVTFMVPLGLGSATAVMVGQALGRGDREEAMRSGWRGLALGCGFMLLSAITLLVLPGPILGLYTTDAAVLAAAQGLLVIAALFQLSDGAQTVATGALRGVGDTRTPAVANLCGHWALGFPLGVLLCFKLGMKVLGLWIGLSLGLTAVAGALVWRWHRESRSVRAEGLLMVAAEKA